MLDSTNPNNWRRLTVGLVEELAFQNLPTIPISVVERILQAKADSNLWDLNFRDISFGPPLDSQQIRLQVDIVNNWAIPRRSQYQNLRRYFPPVNQGEGSTTPTRRLATEFSPVTLRQPPSNSNTAYSSASEH